MEYVVASFVVVVCDVYVGAVRRIDCNGDVAPRSLQSQKAVKVEFDVLRDALAHLAVTGIDERSKWICARASLVVANEDDVGGPRPRRAIEGAPGMEERVDGAVRVDRRSNRWSVLTRGGAFFDAHRRE